MTTPFLLRPRGQSGESLSSWRQRIAWANGFILFPVQRGTLRRTDPDIGLHTSNFDWLASLHGTTPEVLTAMSLRGLVGTVTADVESRRHPAWWVRARYGVSDRAYGSMFCAQCLREDNRPYFRLSWRLGINIACERHLLALLDRCIACGAPPWPAGCAGSERIHRDFTSFDRCWSCSARLAEQAQMRRNPVTWPGPEQIGSRLGFAVSHLEVYRALRAMCQLFLRKTTRNALLATGNWPKVGSLAEQGMLDANSVEYLTVEARWRLLEAGAWLLTDWPVNFLDAMSASGVARAHFCGSRHLHPNWVEATINSALAKQNRTVDESQVRAVVASLKEQGLRVTKIEIWRRLQWQGEIDPTWLE